MPPIRRQRLLAIAVSGALIAAATVLARTEPAGWKEFTAEWKGRRVVLLHAIYDVEYTVAMNVNSTASTYPEAAPVTFVVPDIGPTYRFTFGGRSVKAEDPRELVQRAAVMLDQTDLVTVPGREIRTSDGRAPRARLREYSIGTTMTVLDVSKGKRSVAFVLSRDDLPKKPATRLTVELSDPISDAFAERAAVEQLARSMLHVD